MAEKKAYAYRDKPEILDRLFGTIGLALIVFLMVSLTFFILARFSLSSKWDSSHWLLFWEVLATVLVSRMFLIDDLKKVVGGYSFVLEYGYFGTCTMPKALSKYTQSILEG